MRRYYFYQMHTIYLYFLNSRSNGFACSYVSHSTPLASRAPVLNQDRDEEGRMLQVTVHHHKGVILRGLQACYQGRSLAKIAGQQQSKQAIATSVDVRVR